MAKQKWVLQAKILSALRRVFRNSPLSSECLNKSKTEYYQKCKNGKKKRRVHFTCAVCKDQFNRDDVNVDHIHPVVDPNVGFSGYDEYVKRLFCKVDELQILCVKCHGIKTKQENKLRRKISQTKTKEKKK